MKTFAPTISIGCNTTMASASEKPRFGSMPKAGGIPATFPMCSYQCAFVGCGTCLAEAVDLAVIAQGDTVLMNVVLVLDFVDVPSLIADAQELDRHDCAQVLA